MIAPVPLIVRNTFQSAGLRESVYSIQQVVFRAIYTETNARLQTQAMAIGDINFLTAAEAQAASAMNDGQLLRPWEMWKHKVNTRPL